MADMVAVNVRLKNDQLITDSRNVADVFGKEHRHVLRDIDALKDVPNFGQMFTEGTTPDSYGRPQRVYLMNRDGFTLLAMGFTGAEALKWKLTYINAFNQLEQAWNSPEMVMARGLQASQKLLEQKEQIIIQLKDENARMKPKEIFADAVTASRDTILVRDLAKLLKQNGVDIGEKRLFGWLRDQGYLVRGNSSDYNMPTQRSMEMGLFEIKESTYVLPNGDSHITKTVKVTGKGQTYFINKFRQLQAIG